MEPINQLSFDIIGAAIRIHQRWGPGLLESAYEALLAHELISLGFKVERQKAIPLLADGIRIKKAFRADLIVNGMIIVEVKSVRRMKPVFEKQLLTYLKILDLRLGLLLNFNNEVMRNGVSRVANRV